jgi:hypothetical protein
MFSSKPEGRIQQVANVAGFTPGNERAHEPVIESKLVSGASPFSEQTYEAQANKTVIEKPANLYQTIIERNLFALQPDPSPSAPAVSTEPPTEDLSLTGLMSDFGSVGSAFFMVTAPGKPPVYFTLAEGEQNDWLEVLSVDVKHGTVKARLKKAVMRIRNVGVEVLIFF